VPQQPIITLTTDFGLSDSYVAAMKGVILSLNPEVIIVDVSHAVRTQRVEQGAFLLEAACPYFPPGAIHLAVVDPGVGTARRAIALRTPSGVFLGPDNGILSAALPDDTRSQAAEAGAPVPLPEEVLGVALSNPRYHRQPVSDTFHGRDIFAPAAAHLSLGVPLSDLGEVVSEVFALSPFRARRQPDGGLSGRVVHIDAFGNLITNVRREDVASRRLTVEIGGRRIAGLQRTYAEKPGLTALAGSSGFLEIALAGGSAAAELAADIGEPVLVHGG
jgi:hypothetical protein